jgi:isopenicillin-N N-acyltransferase-like protein
MRFVRAEGTPFERGAIVGSTFAEATARSVAFNRRYLEAHGRDQEWLEGALAPYVEAAQEGLPHVVELIRGTAEGAGLPFLDLFFANAFEEVYGIVELETPEPAPSERCTDVVLRAPGRTLLGHDEQWYAGDDGAVGVVLDVPAGAPPLLAPVIAGTVPLVGINAEGLAVGAMSLSAPDERVGIPRSLIARDLLDARDREDAISRATRGGRAGGYAYLCALPGGDAFVIETTAGTEAVVDVDVHTNHALDPEVAAVACEPSEGSRSRLARVQTLARTAEPTLEGVSALLADHGADGQDICVHPDPADGDEGSTILFAMICETETRTMWVVPGHPCTGTFERFAIDAR